MRSWILISLLLLSVLIHEAQGIRLRRGTPPDGQDNSHKILQTKRSNDGVEEVILCKGNHCSGRVRKLMMTRPISSTTAIAKNQNDKNKENKGDHPELEGSSNSTNEKIATKEENLSVNSSSTRTTTEKRQQAAPETYPGILDIAGMDYSQARRKPPIHN